MTVSDTKQYMRMCDNMLTIFDKDDELHDNMVEGLVSQGNLGDYNEAEKLVTLWERRTGRKSHKEARTADKSRRIRNKDKQLSASSIRTKLFFLRERIHALTAKVDNSNRDIITDTFMGKTYRGFWITSKGHRIFVPEHSSARHFAHRHIQNNIVKKEKGYKPKTKSYDKPSDDAEGEYIDIDGDRVWKPKERKLSQFKYHYRQYKKEQEEHKKKEEKPAGGQTPDQVKANKELLSFLDWFGETWGKGTDIGLNTETWPTQKNLSKFLETNKKKYPEAYKTWQTDPIKLLYAYQGRIGKGVPELAGWGTYKPSKLYKEMARMRKTDTIFDHVPIEAAIGNYFKHLTTGHRDPEIFTKMPSASEERKPYFKKPVEPGVKDAKKYAEYDNNLGYIDPVSFTPEDMIAKYERNWRTTRYAYKGIARDALEVAVEKGEFMQIDSMGRGLKTNPDAPGPTAVSAAQYVTEEYGDYMIMIEKDSVPLVHADEGVYEQDKKDQDAEIYESPHNLTLSEARIPEGTKIDWSKVTLVLPILPEEYARAKLDKKFIAKYGHLFKEVKYKESRY